MEFSPPFSDEKGADAIIKASPTADQAADGDQAQQPQPLYFYVQKAGITSLSTFFDTLLNTCHPDAVHNDLPVAPLDENPRVLEIVLCFAYRRNVQRIGHIRYTSGKTGLSRVDLARAVDATDLTIHHLADAVELSRKYCITDVEDRIVEYLTSAGDTGGEFLVIRSPIETYALACHMKSRNLAIFAAKKTLSRPISQTCDPVLLQYMSATAFYNLVQYHSLCVATAIQALDYTVYPAHDEPFGETEDVYEWGINLRGLRFSGLSNIPGPPGCEFPDEEGTLAMVQWEDHYLPGAGVTRVHNFLIDYLKAIKRMCRLAEERILNVSSGTMLSSTSSYPRSHLNATSAAGIYTVVLMS